MNRLFQQLQDDYIRSAIGSRSEQAILDYVRQHPNKYDISPENCIKSLTCCNHEISQLLPEEVTVLFRYFSSEQYATNTRSTTYLTCTRTDDVRNFWIEENGNDAVYRITIRGVTKYIGLRQLILLALTRN